MIIFLTAAVVILALLLIGVTTQLGEIKKELKAITEEQDRQNEDAIFLLQSRIETAKVIVQHTEVLKFLLDESMKDGGIPHTFMGPMGEA